MTSRRASWTARIVVVALGFTAAIAATPLGSTATERDDRLGPIRTPLPPIRDWAPRRLTVAATGDILTENAILDAGSRYATTERYRFDPLLDPLDPWIEGADLAICHMELPIGRPGARPGVYGRSPFGGNLLLAPFELAQSMADAGYDRCSTASNHSYDLGVDGVNTTLDALDDAGLGHSGTARTAAESAPRVIRVAGVRVAHLSYTTFSNTAGPADRWRQRFPRSPDEVIADVRAARRAGAEVVIVSIHLGKELLRGPLPKDRDFVEAVTAGSEVDLVVQHGPHIVQPVEKVNGTWVFWSVGNLLSGMGSGPRYGPPTLDGLLVWAEFTERRSGRFRVTVRNVLVCTDRTTRVVHPALVALADPATPAGLRTQMEQCVAREEPYVRPLS